MATKTKRGFVRRVRIYATVFATAIVGLATGAFIADRDFAAAWIADPLVWSPVSPDDRRPSDDQRPSTNSVDEVDPRAPAQEEEAARPPTAADPPMVPWETYRTVTVMTGQYVETGVCQGVVGSMGTCYGSTKQFVRVPTEVTQYDYLCAVTLEDAYASAASDVTVTGRSLEENPEASC